MDYSKKYWGGKRGKVKYRILGAFFKCQLLLETIEHPHSVYNTLHERKKQNCVTWIGVNFFFLLNMHNIWGYKCWYYLSRNKDEYNFVCFLLWPGFFVVFLKKKKKKRNREIMLTMLTMLFCKVVFFCNGKFCSMIKACFIEAIKRC